MEMSSTFFLFFFSCKMIEKKEKHILNVYIGLWMRVWIPFHPTKQHSNLCCTSMATLGCVQDNESITHHTESREEGVPFPSNFPTTAYGRVYIHLAYSTTRKPFLHHMLHLPSHQPNTKPCMPGAAAAVRTSYTACFGSTLQVRPTSISWHR
ncbi:unnamed protein product [Musa acuminata subsp. burmannicoides]